MRLRNPGQRRRNTFSRRSRRNQPDMERRQFMGWLLGVGASAAAGTVGVGFLLGDSIVSGQGAAAKTVKTASLHSVLIDSSDPVSTSQSQQINNLLKAGFMDGVVKGDQITVAILTHEQFDPVQWVFKETDPGKGSEANPLFQTPGMVDKQREEGFLSKYYQAISAAQVPIDRPKTPLLAGIESLSKHHLFQGGFTGQNIFLRRRLLIVSDGLENAAISAYRGTLYGQRGMDYVTQHLASLQGVEVTIALISRPKHRHLQDERFFQWLSGFLQRSGAASVTRVDIV